MADGQALSAPLRRIHVIGSSNAGKSTLGAELSEALDMPLVELDALNWLPGWIGLNATDPAAFEQRIAAAVAGERWVVAGSYTQFSQRMFWDRLDTVVWLDLPMPQLIWRMLRRSWRRWRTGELLWGTCREQFWPQLMVWRGEQSLLWWIVTQHGRKRRQMLSFMADPRWAHIRFVQLRSGREITRWVREVAPSPSP
ncbi:MAG: adenylate kinase [Pseudomonadota bacterium]